MHVVAASDDSGAAIGAAFHGLWQLEPPRPMRRIRSDAFGGIYGTSDIDAAIEQTPAVVPFVLEDVVGETIDRLLQGTSWGGFRGGRSSALGPWGTAASSSIPARPTARRS